jgi:predicted CoA-binding protein
MTTAASVETFLAHDRLALVGASRSGKKFGNTLLKDLSAKGWDVTVVHPGADQIDGHRCYSTVAELPEEVEALVVCVPPDETERVVREAAAHGITDVWMQLGSASPAAVRFCEEHGLNTVHDECVLMFARPAGVHRFHRWLWGVFGKLPVRDA